MAEPAMLVFADTVDGPSAVGRSPLRRNVLIATTAAGVAVRPSPLQPPPFAPRPCSPHSSPLAPAALTPRSSPLQPSPLAPRPSPLPPRKGCSFEHLPPTVAASRYGSSLQIPTVAASSAYGCRWGCCFRFSSCCYTSRSSHCCCRLPPSRAR